MRKEEAWGPLTFSGKRGKVGQYGKRATARVENPTIRDLMLAAAEKHPSFIH
ncbi:hypothetical protein ACN28S_53920 [Cystobacter fuscus]